MDIKIIASTQEIGNTDTNLYLFGGKMAGICYMKEDYFDNQIQDLASALKKANITSASGHHSVFEHASITFQLSEIPKILAMLLNSTEAYVTSEKSGRYTVMKPGSGLEGLTYIKWRDIFKTQIKEVYPEIDDKQREKLALENARYLISIFTTTSMGWTVSFRQFIYILNWIDSLVETISGYKDDFWKQLSECCTTFTNKVRELLGDTLPETIHENKNRRFEFLPIQSFGVSELPKEYIGDTYQINYQVSFVSLAQLQRHRTIHYEAYIDADNIVKNGFYIPPIIRGTELESEWLRDAEALAYCYPQCTLIDVCEQGRTIKYFDKCKERLCGRAQIETMENVKYTLGKFIEQRDNMSERSLKALQEITDDYNIVTKCGMKGFKCTETCMWGFKRGLDRLI